MKTFLIAIFLINLISCASESVDIEELLEAQQAYLKARTSKKKQSKDSILEIQSDDRIILHRSDVPWQ